MSTAAPPQFNPFDPSFTETPYELYAALRDDDPVQYSELLCGWVVTRHDDVVALLRDPTVSSSVHSATPTPVTEIELQRLAEQPRAGRTVVMMDDPDHARTRRLMATPFRASAIEALRGRVHERMHAALDVLAERGRTVGGPSTRGAAVPVDFDLVEDFAYPLPVEIFSEMLGVPAEDGPKFRHWTQCVARSVDPVLPDDERDECLAGLDEMCAYLADQAELKRAHPADDLMSHLVRAEIDGERLNDLDLMSQLVTLYMAGHEPTSVLIGNHSTLWRWLLPEWGMERAPSARDLARAAEELGVPFTFVTGIPLPDQFIDNILTSAQAVVANEKFERFEAVFSGAGDTLSAAFCALLASGCDMTEAFTEALSYLDHSLEAGFRPGMGHIVPDRLFWAQPDDDDAELVGGDPATSISFMDHTPHDTKH